MTKGGRFRPQIQKVFFISEILGFLFLKEFEYTQHDNKLELKINE